MLIAVASLLVVVSGAVTVALGRSAAHPGSEWRLDEAVVSARH